MLRRRGKLATPRAGRLSAKTLWLLDFSWLLQCFIESQVHAAIARGSSDETQCEWQTLLFHRSFQYLIHIKCLNYLGHLKSPNFKFLVIGYSSSYVVILCPVFYMRKPLKTFNPPQTFKDQKTQQHKNLKNSFFLNLFSAPTLTSSWIHAFTGRCRSVVALVGVWKWNT